MFFRQLSARQRMEAADKCMKWAGALCVTFVWTFCAAAYYAIWHYVFIPYMMYTGQETLHILILVVFHFLVVLCLYSYYCAIRADPGYVKPGYLPPEMEEGTLTISTSVDERDDGDRGDGANVEMKPLGSSSPRSQKGKERLQEDSESESSNEESETNNERAQLNKEGKRKENNKRGTESIEVVEDNNYCRKCSSYRPSRAHHCRHCGRCVIRMDHHCPWINNCVGHNNLKYFLLFLGYGGCLGVVYISMFGFRAFDIFKHHDKYTTEELWINGVIMGSILWLGFAFTLNLIGMGIHTLGLVVGNITTIERMSVRAQLYRRARTQQKRLRFRYDLGTHANLRQVLGSSPLMWFFPTAPETDGYNSPICPNINDEFELL